VETGKLGKADPYSSKTHRRIDIAVTLVLMVFVFCFSALRAVGPTQPEAHSHRTVDSYEPEARTESPDHTSQTASTSR
jgi:hypothetical protein